MTFECAIKLLLISALLLSQLKESIDLKVLLYEKYIQIDSSQKT